MMYPSIPMWELDRRLCRGEPTYLVDLRDREEYGMCHLRGAINIPYEELEMRICELPMDQVLYFYCARGSQSLLICNLLSRRGYRVVNVGGGMNAYRGNCLEGM